MSSSRAGPVPARIAVRSMITVTYLSPRRVCRHTCSSTPITADAVEPVCVVDQDPLAFGQDGIVRGVPGDIERASATRATVKCWTTSASSAQRRARRDSFAILGGAAGPAGVLPPHMSAVGALVAADRDQQRRGAPAERLVREPAGHDSVAWRSLRRRSLRHQRSSLPVTGTTRHRSRPAELETLPGHLQPELVEPAERRQISSTECGRSSVRHVEVFRMSGVRTLHPRETSTHITAPTRRTDDHTLVCEEPLYDVVGAIYDWVGFDVVDDAVFRDLVIARIVEPTSKVDSLRVLTDLGADTVSYRTIQRHLARVNAHGYRDAVAAKCFTHAADRGGLSLLLYDVTTLYFEAENEDDLRKVGYSKERRIDPQIVVGLLVDRTGFPLEIGCFEGNTAETTTIVPIITAFAARHDLGQTPMVVAADAGMLSAANLTALDDAGLGFIVGSRTVKAPIDLASHFHWHGDVFTDRQIIDTVTPRHGKTVVNDTNKRAEPVWDPEQHPGAWRAIWAYSAKRARRDQKTLHAQEARAKAVINGERAAKSTRFVKVAAGARILDEASLARAQSLVGLKGYVTNIAADAMPAGEVIAKYHDLWHVEKAFRMSKTDLAARPMFHRTRDAIEAHLTIVFTALAVAHCIQERSGLAIANVIKQLRPLRSATIVINGATQTFPPEIPQPQRQTLQNLGINVAY